LEIQVHLASLSHTYDRPEEREANLM